MLLAASALKGYAIQATDGRMGLVSDLLFDDKSWKVHWVVIETGTWLTGRKVLVHPSAIIEADHRGQVLLVALTKEKVERSPDISQDKPVSRQMESHLFDYYGYDPYWGSSYFPAGGLGMGVGGMPMGGLYPGDVGVREASRQDFIAEDGDPNLRSAAAVTGYHVRATDGSIGHVENFLLDDRSWSIRYVIVDTKNWWPGQHVLLSPYAVREIEWSAREIHLDVPRELVKGSPPWDPASLVEEAYERQLHNHYRWPGYGF